MKTAIYVEDGVKQIVLTPEDDFEKDVVSDFQNENLTVRIISGSFYNCNGGFVRHGQSDESIILRVENKK